MKNLIIVTGGAGFIRSSLIKSLLEKTPLSDNNFKAAKVNVAATKFIILKNNRLLYLSVIFGLIIGIFYTLISDAFRYRNKLKKN